MLPEGDDDRILQAADILMRRKVADLTILGDPRWSSDGPGCWASTYREPAC